MKKLITLSLLMAMTLVTFSQSSVNTLLCTDASCGTTLANAPTDGTSFTLVWVVSSPTAPTNASLDQTGAGVAVFGTPTITSIGSGNYTIAWSGTIDDEQGLATTFTIPVDMKLYTSSPFVPALTTSFSIATATALPVDFISVDVIAMNEMNIVEWKTASEINNDIFEVERSNDGDIWEVAGVIPGAGNSSELLNYSFEDHVGGQAFSFYRVKQTDFDGKFEYSDIVKVKASSEAVSVYPNPVKNNELFITSNAEEMNISVTNSAGQAVSYEFNSASSKLTFGSEVNSGIYFVSVNGTVSRVMKY
jgi:hypothetical protein